MNLETFFSSEVILEDESILLRPLSIDDIDKIESISYNKELGEFGVRVKNRAESLGTHKPSVCLRFLPRSDSNFTQTQMVI